MDVMTITPETASPYAAAREFAGAKNEHKRQATGEQRPIDEGDIDLSFMMVVCMDDVKPGKEAKRYGLRCERERSGYQGLRGDNGRDSCKRDHGVEHHMRHHTIKELALFSRWFAEQKSALPKVIQNERWKHDREPANSNGARAKMPKVRIHGLAACHHQHERPKRQENALRSGFVQKCEGVNRVERFQDLWVLFDLHDAKHRDYAEPENKDGAEYLPHASRSVALDREQERENNKSDRDDGVCEHRCRGF